MWNYSHAYRGFFRALRNFIRDPFLWFYGFSWVLIRITRKTENPIPFINNWLTDFVFIPLICVCSHYFILYILPSHYPKIKYPLLHILILATWVSYIYEFVMPSITTYNVKDYFDIIAYFAGGFFYYFVHQKYVMKNYRK